MPTPNRVQPIRSNVSGARNVAGRLPGELYTNWADAQIGVVTPTGTAMDLVGVRFFSASANYNIGDYVLNAGVLYRAIVAVTAGAWNPAQWTAVATQSDIAAATANLVPDAPPGGGLYVRVNGAWVLSPIQSDAPDSALYFRQRGAWASLASSEIVPIGGMMPFGGSAAPANWLICDGSSYSTTDYAALFAVIGYAYGGSGTSFSVPSLVSRFPMGATPGTSGGAGSVSLTTSNMPSHAHNVPAHGHTASSSQSPHSHYVYQDAHSHTYQKWLENPSPPGVWVYGQLTYTQGYETDNTSSAQPAVHADTQQPAVSTSVANAPAMVTDHQGGGTAFSTLPPYVGVNYIIRAT